MLTTPVCCSRWGRANNSCGCSMFTLWPSKWTLLLLVTFLMNKVAAKWPPDPQPRFYPPPQQHWPRQYFDNFAIESRIFGNEKSMEGNGNALFGNKAIADEIALRDFEQSNDVALPAEARRHRQLQWLGSWLFGRKQQPQWQVRKKEQQMAVTKQPQWPQTYLQGQQQTPHAYDLHRHDADIFVYKKTPEIMPGEEEKHLQATDVSDNDVADTKSAEEVGDKQDTSSMDTTVDYDYKIDVEPASERFNTEQPPRSKRIFYAPRTRRLDYAYIPYTAYQHDREQELAEAKKLAFKRNKTGNGERSFLPSISAGAMTHLGNFFTDLSKNVRYNEKSQSLGHEEAKLLEGQHPLRQLHEKIAGEHEANAEFLHAIRTYRPSQKIRSLVAMNPRGYHGAQFIDPNYMWVGLGK
ncbi:uncharacterized protein LOC118743185 [Rhagoletis pomonella]|uniref:uncharacterized protein LOC118743185 n=1 Tax=Rhagoletis pomonella TaxID=28610 RepID=UPI00177A81C9|nr:uncharacterized protein LOC118743185 [Rhagoletis pomonella]